MAFDGFTVSALCRSLDQALTGGRITKISQPEPDELLLTIKNYSTYKLLLSANASLPLAYLTEESKAAPLKAPNFCMLLRKHLNSARILSITQPGLERVLRIEIEHLDELGDKKIKYLIMELMGKHSNIIFCSEENRIIDSIKHVSAMVSSVREVLPGREYFLPQTTEKQDPLQTSGALACAVLASCPLEVPKSIYTSFTGFSPIMASELCHRSGLLVGVPFAEQSPEQKGRFLTEWELLMQQTADGDFSPAMVRKQDEPIEYAPWPLRVYSDFSGYELQSYESISRMLELYYQEKNQLTRMRQHSGDLRKIVQTAYERTVKKLDLQTKQLADTEKKETFRIYGELLTTYGYQAPAKAKSFSCLNYYTNEEIVIPLDDTLSALDNAKQYFNKYSKLKRTAEQLTGHLEASKEELAHLDSIREFLKLASSAEDLAAIRRELMDFGYLKFRKDAAGDGKKNKKVLTTPPLHYRTPEGYDIYVGKNNYQNEELTFRFASGADWWFHAKGVPGSHVILKTNGEEPPAAVFEAAGSLAAFYSKNKDNDKVEIDYTLKKNVKKPAGQKPGFVVYYTNYSLIAIPELTHVTEINDAKGFGR